MFRLSIATLTFAFCVPLYAGDQGDFVFTGVPVDDGSVSQHIQGKEVAVYKIVAAAHEMNLRGGRQPVDLRFFFNIISDPSSGHAAYCQAAFARVLSDRQALSPGATAVPYLQINVALLPLIITSDEGDLLYSDSAVNCWEAMDPRP